MLLMRRHAYGCATSAQMQRLAPLPLRVRAAAPARPSLWTPYMGGRRGICSTRAPKPSGAAAESAAEGAYSAPPTSRLRAVAYAYERSLAYRPIFTKSVTSAVLYGAGDCAAQALSRSATQGEEGAVRFDGARLLRAVLFGGVFYPGLAHLHYNFLERLVVHRLACRAAYVPWVKMFIEQFVYWSYFSNAYYHCVLGMLQGWSAERCVHRVQETLWDTLKAQWAFWVPAQLINFRYVPVRHQLNFVLCVSFFWTTFLSLAFPPGKAKAA